VPKKTIRDLDLKDRRVFIRVDYNVPLKKGVIGDDTRIRETLPTIDFARKAGARCIVLASHLGRPKGKPNPEMSLAPVAARLSELLNTGRPDPPGPGVSFAEDCIGTAAENAVSGAPPGSIVLLENLRFHPEEEKNDERFARSLARLADVYVNDAFGAAHRAHASVEALVRLMPEAGAGLLGGAKVSDKIEVIDNLVPRVDRLLIGGAMAYTFLKAMGKPTGTSLVEDDKLGSAREIMKAAEARTLQLLLPTDHIVAPKLEAGVPSEVLSVDAAEIGERMGLDIGPATAQDFRDALRDAKTVVWNGPMGVFEIPDFAKGTVAVAKAVAEVKGTTIVGGGDSIAAVKAAGVTDRITHISTGGGASLEFLGGQTLPGVAVLPDK
jgi:phosphoglycerate kinase